MDLSVKKIIGLALALYIMAYLLPGAITQIENANQTGWGSGTSGIWGVIGIVAVVGVIWMVWKSSDTRD